MGGLYVGLFLSCRQKTAVRPRGIAQLTEGPALRRLMPTLLVNTGADIPDDNTEGVYFINVGSFADLPPANHIRG